MADQGQYYKWKAEVLGDNYWIWHDGLNVSAVKSLTGGEREHAIRMLRAGVEFGDSDAATALAAMGEDSNVAEMRIQLRDATDGEDKVHIACAIHALSPDDELAKEIIPVLETPNPPFSDQRSAAIALRNFADAPSERALLDAIVHAEEYLVRYHAAESLLKRWHTVPADIAEHREIFDLIRSPHTGVSTANEVAGRREAVVRLEGLRNRDG